MAKKEKVYNKELYSNDQIILQFLSAQKYKPKDTLKAMAEHAEFKLKYLPTINPEKMTNLLVGMMLLRNQGFTTHVEEICASVPS